MNRERVIARAIVTAKDGQVWNELLLSGQIRSKQRRVERVAGQVFVPPVRMHALFVRPICRNGPVRVECMLHTTAGMYRIRRFVAGIDKSSCATKCRSGQTA